MAVSQFVPVALVGGNPVACRINRWPAPVGPTRGGSRPRRKEGCG